MRRVVLVGGGYGCLHAFKEMRRASPKLAEVEVTLVSRDAFHTYHGWTGEVLSGRLRGEETFSDLRSLLSGGRFMLGEATAIDLERRRVEVACADGTIEMLEYDDLVLGTGSVDPLDRIAGAREHSYRLKDPHELLRLEARLMELEIRTVSDDVRIAVIGGGFSGVEAAAAIAQRFEGAPGHVLVYLAAARQGILPAVRGRFPRMVAETERVLSAVGVAVFKTGRVTEVRSDRIIFEDGTSVPVSLSVIAAGVGFEVIRGTEVLPRENGRIVVDRSMRVPGYDGVWAVGDAASARLPGGDGECPTAAIWAMRQGELVGSNIIRAVRGRPTRPFRFKGFGQAAGLGGEKAVAELYGVQLSGRPAALIRLGFFAWYMPSRSAGMRLFKRLARGPARIPAASLSKEGSYGHTASR